MSNIWAAMREARNYRLQTKQEGDRLYDAAWSFFIVEVVALNLVVAWMLWS